jgi:dsDNA-specific endonuclease/ATPase MutS2
LIGLWSRLLQPALREDRFVLPLRASFKSMGLRTAHDMSRTGETALVELNNRVVTEDPSVNA